MPQFFVALYFTIYCTLPCGNCVATTFEGLYICCILMLLICFIYLFIFYKEVQHMFASKIEEIKFDLCPVI